MGAESGLRKRLRGVQRSPIGRLVAPMKCAREALRYFPNSFSGTFVNKDEKDRKRRGIVAQTPASSKMHQALASSSSRSPKARARLYSLPILQPVTLQNSPSAPSVL
jgi:hypothetical protein